MKVFDSIYTADGFEIYWLHEHTDTTLQNPENDLYQLDYEFYEVCQEIVQSGADFENYVFSDKQLKDMRNDR
jgi:hypothetical protein